MDYELLPDYAEYGSVRYDMMKYISGRKKITSAQVQEATGHKYWSVLSNIRRLCLEGKLRALYRIPQTKEVVYEVLVKKFTPIERPTQQAARDVIKNGVHGKVYGRSGLLRLCSDPASITDLAALLLRLAEMGYLSRIGTNQYLFKRPRKRNG